MKHSWILAAALIAAWACSPQIYPLYMEVRQPSASGIDLSGKEIAIVYANGTSPADSIFDRSVASALARTLEEDYFGSQERIGIFHNPSDSASLDLMHSLVMDTGGDVIFYLSSKLGEPELFENQPVKNATSADSAYLCRANVPIKTSLDVYDAMGSDEVHHFSGSAKMMPAVFNSGISSEDGLKQLVLRSTGAEAEVVGRRISNRFLSKWSTESFSFYYFDGSRFDQWAQGIERVSEGKFSAAVDLWAPLAKEGSIQSRACACYNIAQAFYLMGDYRLSTMWLDEAEKLENISLAPGLRKRLEAHLQK